MKDSIGQLLSEIGRYPVLAQEEVRELIAIAQSDRPDAGRAKARIVRHNLKLVVSVAKKYLPYCKSLEFADLFSEGAQGLQRAVEKFDLSKPVQFSTYATVWIRQSISRAFYGSDRLIRLPIHVFEKRLQIHKAVQRLHRQLGRTPTLEEIGCEVEETVDWVEKHLGVPRINSLNAMLQNKKGEDAAELESLIPADGESPLDYAIATETQDQVRAILAQLDGRDRQILEMRFGLDDGVAKPLEEIGRLLGLSRERIRQIESRAKTRFKRLGLRSQPLPLQTQETVMSDYNSLLAAIERVERGERVETLKALCKLAGLHDTAIYNQPLRSLLDRAKKAIREAKVQEPRPELEKKEQPTDPTYSALTGEIETLRQRNRELRQQIADLQEQKQRPMLVEVAVPANWLRQQVEEWRGTVRELREDLEGAEKNLAAYERLLEIHHDKGLDVAEVNIALNGHNGNGSGAIAVGGNS